MALEGGGDLNMFLSSQQSITRY